MTIEDLNKIMLTDAVYKKESLKHLIYMTNSLNSIWDKLDHIEACILDIEKDIPRK